MLPATLMRIKNLHFVPFFGLSSWHLQMVISAFSPRGKEPPSTQLLVELGQGDKLSCEISIPPQWKANDETVVMVHGLGGSHASRYMIRMSRKLYGKGYKVARVNLRGCGSGKGMSKLGYNAGNSHDVLKVIEQLKLDAPQSAIALIGFSLGGNLALKLGGELSAEAKSLIKTIIAICPPFDLKKTVLAMQETKNYLYHKYFLKGIQNQAETKQKFMSVFEYDEKVTGPTWGFSGAQEYYDYSSSKHYLSKISIPCHILCAKDDPFVSVEELNDISLPDNVHLWITQYGSHMGFLGRKEFQWLDQLLVNWIEGKFL